jgi:hypothetical protein
MTEVRQLCPACGRETWLEAGPWSGVTTSARDPLCPRCAAVELKMQRSSDSRSVGVGTIALSFLLAGVLIARHAGLL